MYISLYFSDPDEQGVSEMIVGKAIKKYNIPREKLVILTKCYGIVNDDPYGEAMFDPSFAKQKEYVNKRGNLILNVS
jgi:aryl-alcohol dehydrogenase-like predicted oxidoreductase